MRDLSIRGAGIFLVFSKVVSSTQSDLKCTATLGKAINKRQGKTQVRRKGNAEFNLQIDAYLLLTIFLTSAKKLKFISVFVN
ncbi:MAG: hypothetical protein ACLTNP_02800 [Streptococcus salivarius]